MSLHQYIDDVEVTVENEPTPGPWETASHGGEMGGGGDEGAGAVVVVDPNGTLDLRGWKDYRADETACVGRESIFRGFIKGKQIRRGAEGPIGPGRVWECEIGDGHLLLGLRILEGSDSHRPPETNLERIDWLLTKLQGYGVPLYDTGHVIDSHPRPFEDADYTDQTAQDVLDDIAGIIGRDYFVFWDFDASGGAKWALWYNQRAANDMASSLSISNVAGEANYSTIFPTGAAAENDDASLSRQPDEVFSRDIVKYRHGKVIRTLASTATNFIERDHFTDNSRIGLQSTATVAGDSFLEAHADEKDTVTVPVRLPADKVNLAIAGETIDLHLEHLPGYEADFVTTRISKRTVSKPTIDAFYDVLLECTLAAPAATGGPPSSDFPHDPDGAVTIIQQNAGANDRTMPDPITDGSEMVLCVGNRDSTFPGGVTAPPPGYTLGAEGVDTNPYGICCAGATDTISLWTKTASSEDQSTTGSSWAANTIDNNMVVAWYELSAGSTVTAHNAGGNSVFGTAASLPAVAMVKGDLAIVIFEYEIGDAVVGPFFTPGAGLTEDCDARGFDGHPAMFAGHHAATTTESFVATATLLHSGPWMGQIYVFHSDGSDVVPSSGQRFGPVSPVETPDGTTTTFTLPAGFEFADASLVVMVNRLDQTLAVTSYDGAARTFTLAFAPKVGWLVEVFGQGR